MASTNLSRANGSGSATTKFTYSVWLKYSGWYTGGQRFFSSTGGSGDTYFRFNETGEMEISGDNSAATSFGYFITNRKFRDHSAWMHIVIKSDTTQSTQTDRFKLYINGVDEAGVGGYSTGTYPNQNADDNISLSSNTHYIGGAASSQYFNGLMTHIHYSDGYAYDASTFGETDSTSGIWKPKTNPTGITYGTNGYFLKMENSGAMGTDSSGNTNTFSVANGTLTQNIDTPSNNFVTMNPLDNYYNTSTFTNGNTTVTTPSSGYSGVIGGMGASKGKWYFEFKPVSKTGDADEYSVGITGAPVTSTNQPHWKLSTGYEYLGVNGNYYNNDSGTSYGNTFTAGDIIGVAMDLDNSKLYFSKNGTFQNSGVPTSGSTGTGAISITAPGSTPIGFYLPCCAFTSNSAGATMSFNFGSGYFGTTAVASANADANGHGAMEYAVPSGFYTLNTKNLKEFG
tara:strand:+ start:820 stop:2184 length:1365 start_codon:yes stop_codon:yes gene_type:complete